jgi:hypothetical protein
MTKRRKASKGTHMASTVRRLLLDQFFFIGFAATTIVGLLTFSHFGGRLFFALDASEYISDANSFLRNDGGFYLQADYLHTLGDLNYPINFRFIPEFALAFDGQKISPVACFLIASVIGYLANYAFARSLDFSRPIALFASLGFLAASMPYVWPALGTNFFSWESQKWLPLVYTLPFINTAFVLIGRLSRVGNLMSVALYVLGAIWIIGTQIKFNFITVIVIVVFQICFVLAITDFREFILKTVANLILFIVCLFGPITFVSGMFVHSTNAVLVQGVAGAAFASAHGMLSALASLYSPTFSEHLYEIGFAPGWILLLIGASGCISSLISWRDNRTAAAAAAATLLLICLSFVFIFNTSILMTIYSAIVLFAVVAIQRFLFLILHRIDRSSPERDGMAATTYRIAEYLCKPFQRDDDNPRQAKVCGLIVLVCSVLIICRGYLNHGPRGIEYPPRKVPFLDYLAGQISFDAGDEFRGRFLDIVGRHSPPQDLSDTLVKQMMDANLRFSESLGNDLGYSGPAYFNIPMGEEYNRLASPENVVFFSMFLTEPDALQLAAYRLITRPDPRFLALLGVRYILDDKAHNFPDLALRNIPLPARDLRLYEIEHPNLGQYSPTKIIRTKNFADVVKTMKEDDFDPRSVIITEPNFPVNLQLVPADNVKVTRRASGIRVRAESTGQSVVLLPFEYTNCNIVTVRSGRLLGMYRADLLITALTFEGSLDAELGMKFGPFTNTSCRKADMQSLTELGLNYDSLQILRNVFSPYFQFEAQSLY